MATAWCWFGCQGKPTRAGKQKQNGACWAQTPAAGATQRTATLLRNLGSLANRTLLNEARQPWPQKLSMKCTRTQHGVVQYVNLQIARQFQYVPDPASPQRCQLAHPHLPAMTCENAVPNQQGQSFKGKQGNCRQIAHMSLTVNSAMRVPNLALRAWTCGTALAKWVVLGTEPCSAKPGSHGLKHVL